MAKILVVDDEESVCWAFEKFLQAEGHDVRTAATAETAISSIADGAFDIVFLDVRLPGMDGLTALEKIKNLQPELYVVVITAHGTMDTAIEAVKRGAFDYLPKPAELGNIRNIIVRIEESRKDASETVELPTGAPPARIDLLVGHSPLMQEVYKKIGAVAPTDASVLIEGESGTGKELVARAIHHASERKKGFFVPVACGALPENLLESELFGHVRGAFTGATADRDGKFQKADGGSLFLDEVGSMSLKAQVKLLRFLQEHEFEKIGSTDKVTVNTRVIAATNEPLLDKVQNGEFREDLYYRLNVIKIELPPLRSRKEDIPLLVSYFLAQAPAGERTGCRTEDKTITKPAMETLTEYDWPGNVRELKNAVEHAAALSHSGPILRTHLPEHVTQEERQDAETRADILARDTIMQLQGGEKLYDTAIGIWEKSLLKHALELNGGNQVATAAFLGISRSTLRKKIADYGL